MKMGKKVREYKSGDFIFAKVKGYPAWPARVQKMNGKKYFVYFYGTGETANLPPNMIFDYAENKDKFLTKTVKRRDFNDGVRQIEHDFANNVPLEQVIGGPVDAPPEANDTANDTADETMDDSAVADTTADDTMADESTANATASNDNAVEDSDDAGALVIDEGKKGRKSKADLAKASSTPAKPGKEAKTPRGKAKKDDKEGDEEEKKDEIVSRSGRKIRPKRYIDEQTEDNATLPSPVPKKRRATSPEKETKDKPESKEKSAEKSGKLYNAVSQSELEDLKEPFKPEDPEKDNILIAYLPTGQYIGVKLMQSRPASFKNEAARLQWDKQQASNAITLKLQLERGQITPQSIQAQLVMDLNLTDEEKASLDKERETEEKKSRVQFLKTEMKLIELDAKIKTCLCLEKADTELCLKLLDELMELEVKPLMLLKHPTCLETVKRMRAYVGNTPSWDLSEAAALVFSKQAHRIRKQADTLYKNMKDLFITPEGLSFWEFFSDRVLQFKKATAKLTADELLELVHEPLEMTMPTSHTMKAAVDAANDEDHADKEEEEKEETQKKKTATPAKPKKNATATPSKPNLKRQSSRKQQQEDKEKEKEAKTDKETEETTEEQNKDAEKNDEAVEEKTTKEAEGDATNNKDDENKEPETNNKEANKSKEKEPKNKEKGNKSKEKDTKSKEKEPEVKDAEESKEKDNEVQDKEAENKEKSPSPSDKEKANEKNEEVKEDKEADDKDDKDVSEPRAKRSRESKKTEAPPPRSPAKRKSKF